MAGNRATVPDSVDAGFSTAGQAISQGRTVQQVQTKYQTAVSIQKERNLEAVRDKCLVEARIAGEEFFYHWEVSNKQTGKKEIIEGASIHCAIAAARNFGNCAIESAGVEVTDKEFIFNAAFIDIETGFTMTRPFRMDRNFTVYGRMDNFRKDDIRFQIGASKAIRNVVSLAMPRGLINQMLEAAKGSVRSKIEAKIASAGGDIDHVIGDMLAGFIKFGIDQLKIETKLGLKREYWDVDTLVMLTGDLKALRDGSETAEALFGEPGPQTNGERASASMAPGDPTTHQSHKQQQQPAQPAPAADEPPQAKATAEPASTPAQPEQPAQAPPAAASQAQQQQSGRAIKPEIERATINARLRGLLAKHAVTDSRFVTMCEEAITIPDYDLAALREFCDAVASYPLKKDAPGTQGKLGGDF